MLKVLKHLIVLTAVACMLLVFFATVPAEAEVTPREDFLYGTSTVPMAVTFTDNIVHKNNYTSSQLAYNSRLRAATTILLCFDFSMDSHSNARQDDIAYMDTSYFAEKDGQITVLLRGRNYLDGYNLVIMYTPADRTAAYTLFSTKEDGSFAMLKAAVEKTNVTVYENDITEIVEIANALGMNYYVEYEAEVENETPSEVSTEIIGTPDAGQYFSSGLLPYRHNGKWGYIDSNGKTVIPYQWDYADEFSEGLAMVFNGALNKYGKPDKGVYGVINTTGGYIIPLMECASIHVDEPIENDISISYEADSQGTQDCTYEYWRVDGTKIGNDRWDDAYDPDNGKLLCASKNNKWGYVNRETGEVTINYQYDVAENFIDGIACVGKRQNLFRVSYEYIDETGNVIIEDKGWDVAYPFEEGSDIAAVFKGSTLNDGELADEGKYGLINKEGKFLCDYIWDSVDVCDNDLIIVSSAVNGKTQYGVIDSDLNFIVEPSFDYISEYSQGRAYVFTGSLSEYGYPEIGSYSFVDENGNMIAGLKWSQADIFKPDGFAVIGVTDTDTMQHYGIIDKAGNMVVKPIYDDIPGKGTISELFSEGLTIIQTNGKYGYINKSGDLIFDAEWDKAEKFREGKAVAWKGGVLYILNPDGSTLQVK